MVILSMVIGALFAWQQVSLATIDRARAHAERNQVVRSALSIMDHVNIMKQPSGARTAGTLKVSWRSTLVTPRKGGQTASGQLSAFDLELRKVDVTVTSHDRALARFTYRKVGYLQTRQPSSQG